MHKSNDRDTERKGMEQKKKKLVEDLKTANDYLKIAQQVFQ
jgi:hypothetical protein